MPAVAFSVIAELAQGVADLLDLQTFSMEFEADRGWAPHQEIEALANPTVTVVPIAKTVTNASRGLNQNDVQIAVVVQRQHGDSNPSGIGPVERCDELAALAQEVEDFLGNTDNKIVTENLSARPWNTTAEIDSERLVTEGIFAVSIVVTYRLWR